MFTKRSFLVALIFIFELQKHQSYTRSKPFYVNTLKHGSKKFTLIMFTQASIRATSKAEVINTKSKDV